MAKEKNNTPANEAATGPEILSDREKKAAMKAKAASEKTDAAPVAEKMETAAAQVESTPENTEETPAWAEKSVDEGEIAASVKPKTGTFPKWFIPILAVAALVIVGVFMYPRLFPKTPRQLADEAFADKRFATASKLYQELYAENETDDELAAMCMLSLFHHQDWTAMFAIYDYNIAPRITEMDPAAVEKMQPAIDAIDSLDATVNALNEVATLSTNEERIAALEAKSGQPKISDGIIAFLKAVYMTTDPAEVRALLGETYEKDPRFHFTLAQKGTLERRAGNLDTAVADYQRALAEDKEDAEAHRGLAIVTMLQGGSGKKALSYAQKAYELAPEGSFVMDTLATTYIYNNQKEEAEALMALMEANPDVGVDDTLKQYLAGEKTLEQIYLGDEIGS